MLESEPEWYRRTRDGADDRRSRSGEERLDHEVRPEPIEARRTEEDEQERGRKGDKGGEQCTTKGIRYR